MRNDRARNSSAFVIAQVPSGQQRVLLQTEGAFSLSIHWQWMADSQGLVVRKGGPGGDGSAPVELWHLPLNGPPRKLDVDARQWGEGFSIHPDGHQIAFAAQAGAPGDEVWALERFLPSPVGSQSGARPRSKAAGTRSRGGRF